MRRPGPSKVRAETLALAHARARKTASLATASSMEPEEQVYLLRALCGHLWRLLDRRRDGHMTPEEVFAGLSWDAKAAVDRTLEAAFRLIGEGIYAEPCRRILDEQLQGEFRYVLIYPDGNQRIVTEDELLMMAGV